jgi:hypothetical protein
MEDFTSEVQINTPLSDFRSQSSATLPSVVLQAFAHSLVRNWRVTECILLLKYSSPYIINQQMHIYKHFQPHIIIIIIIIISFMQGIYTYIPETNYVPREYNVAAILLLIFMVESIVVLN